MEKELLKSAIAAWLPEASFDESGEFLTLETESTHFHGLASHLRFEKDFDFDYLFCLTCIDWKSHLTMVYHLTSIRFRHTLVLKCKLDAAAPKIHTVSDLWQTANFHEREVYEMFGVDFINHPDLRLLILPDGWEGKKPLRKDFEDPINMIKL
jgi:hypothetical protein